MDRFKAGTERLKGIDMDRIKKRIPGQGAPKSPSSESTSTLGSVKGFVSKRLGSSASTEPEERQTRSIRELRDPTSFPPPPKRTASTPYTPPESPGTPTSPYDASRQAPRLPPRLPPRKPSVDSYTTAGPQASLNRLASAGVSVPGFEIGSQQQQQPPPTSGTSFAEKKAAVQTANKFYNNPTSVSMSDARSALSTGANFQQRHGSQVADGLKTAEKLQGRFGGGADRGPPPPLGRLRPMMPQRETAESHVGQVSQRGPSPPPRPIMPQRETSESHVDQVSQRAPPPPLGRLKSLPDNDIQQTPGEIQPRQPPALPVKRSDSPAPPPPVRRTVAPPPPPMKKATPPLPNYRECVVETRGPPPPLGRLQPQTEGGLAAKKKPPPPPPKKLVLVGGGPPVVDWAARPR